MGIYEEQVLPRFIDVMLGNREFAAVRREVCTDLHDDVLEIGFGSGLNMEFLPEPVTGVWTVEPSRVGMQLAAKRIAASSVPVTTGELNGERLDFPDARFDAALSTMTLCTIPNVDAALHELRRVLKPGAQLHFAEHGLSPDSKVARWQDRLTPVQRHIAGGCHFNRDIGSLVTNAGFEIETVRNFYLKGPKFVGYMYVGRARNPSSYTGPSPEG